MTKKEPIGPNKKVAKESVKGTDEAGGSFAVGENDIETEFGGDAEIPDQEDTEREAGEGEDVAEIEEEVETPKEPKRKRGSREKELESKLKEQHDKYLRLSAEFDNYRKRMMKERTELTQYVGAEIYTKMLPVMDDFERAISSMKSTEALDAMRQGIELIYNKFKEHLNQQGVKEIDALHKDFNTDYHDAVSKFPVLENELKGKVIEVVEKGYTLNDKVIRYCKVVVGE
jgi:molecular chaperone GrpE